MSDKDEVRAKAQMKVIVEAIDGLEGLPVDYSLARELSKVALEIRETFNWKREVKP